MRLEKAHATLILMRHGETAWNRERRIMGDLDIPLTDEGRAQCEGAAALLAGYGVTRIVSSPLVRAAESAAIVSARLGLPVEHDARLVEVRFGQWQGLTYEEVGADPRYAAFAADPVANPTPGGETVRDVQARGLEGLGAAMATAGDGAVRHPRRHHPHSPLPLPGDAPGPLPPPAHRQRRPVGHRAVAGPARGEVPQRARGHRTDAAEGALEREEGVGRRPCAARPVFRPSGPGALCIPGNSRFPLC